MSNFKFNIDMQQFRAKAKIYADNVDTANTIEWTNGKFQTLQPQPFLDFLNDCCIFYTLSVSSPRDGGWYPAESHN